MKLKNKLEIDSTLKVGALPTASASNFSVLFENGGTVSKRTVGDIINKNSTDFIQGISNSFPSIFNYNTSTTPSDSNLVVSFKNQLAGTVFAAPTTLNGTPSFRKLIDSDLSETSIFSQLGNYVTLDTEQEVTGKKVFSAQSHKLGTNTAFVEFGFDGNPSDSVMRIISKYGNQSTHMQYEAYSEGVGFMSFFKTDDNITVSPFTLYTRRVGLSQFTLRSGTNTEVFKISGDTTNTTNWFFQMPNANMKFALGYFTSNAAFNIEDVKAAFRGSIYSSSNVFANGFKKHDSSDDYVLLGGGGHKLVSDFALSTDIPDVSNFLSKNISNIVTQDFEITDGWAILKVGESGAIYGEIPGVAQIDLGSEDGFAVAYYMNNGSYFEATTSGVNGNDGYGNNWSLSNSNDVQSQMLMPETGSTNRVLSIGAKVGDTTYYANTQGIVELPDYPDVSGFVPSTRTITAGNGLSGGGTLAANRTITLGTPTAIGLSTTNSVTSTSHTHELDSATTTAINNGQTAYDWGNHANKYLSLNSSANGALSISTVDLNNPINGNYVSYQQSSSPNKPLSSGGFLTNYYFYSASTHYNSQSYDSVDSNRFFKRYRQTASWVELWHDGNLKNVSQLNNDAGYITSSSLPTVNNGQLTLSTGTGLSGSATFTANQSGNSTFSVAVASTHKLPTTAEWNALPTTNTITRLRGTTSGTYTSGDLTLIAGANTTITQSGASITIASTNTNTTYSGSTSIILSGTSFQRAALTGDVTAAQNSNATTIANSAVTHAKYQNIATQRILGRGATGTGNVQELTLGTGLTLSTAGVLSATNTSSGTVTSVGLTISGNALNTNLATITSSGTFGLTWGGTTAQYVNGQGNLVTFPSIPSISNLVTTNTQQTVNAKKQWTTPQTNVPISNYREISNIGAWVGSSSHSSTTYYMFNLGDALPAVMWEAELVLIQYSYSTAVNTSPSRSLTIKVSGYNSSAGSSLVNKRVEVIEGDSSIIDNVTYFRDANNLLSVGIKLNTSAPYPKGYFKTIRLHHSVNDTRENSIVNNASVTALTDISSLTSVSVVSATNILKNIDSGNINSIDTLVQTTRTITAGNGLTGGGTLAANRTITLGTPGDITLSSTSSVGTSSHTHAFNPGGTTSQYIRGDGSLATYANTTYTAGTGLSLSGTTFGQTITTSGTGTYVQSITQTANGFQVNLGTPPNTTYSAGTLALLQAGANTSNRVWSAKILADYVTSMMPTSILSYSSANGIIVTDWNSFALSEYAMSLGYGSVTSGNYATSVGSLLSTTGFGSTNQGYSNSITKALGYSVGAYNSINATLAGGFGIGLINRNDGAFIVGRYNSMLPIEPYDTTSPHKQAVFAIGAGRDETDRFTALTVYGDGRADYAHGYDDSTWTDNTLVTKKWVQDNAGGGGGGVEYINVHTPGTYDLSVAYVPSLAESVYNVKNERSVVFRGGNEVFHNGYKVTIMTNSDRTNVTLDSSGYVKFIDAEDAQVSSVEGYNSITFIYDKEYSVFRVYHKSFISLN